jgi:serine/threonine-protein kinase
MKTCPLCDTAYPNQHSSCDRDGALLIESRDLEAGAVIRGKYRIARLLGRGGMGTVYLAEHILLGRQRALKFISSELSRDATFLRRFRREAQAAIDLQHPNVVQVVDLDQAEDGSPYIAMEYVDGTDLRHALDAGAFPVERALAIARGIAQGLGAAHLKGIVHRDVKPENILLAGGNGAPETPKLLDFGIASLREGATAISRTDGVLLTPKYAAPEQWQGLPSEQLDGRVDFYALGGVLYEMLTGQTCFHAHNTEGWMYQHLQQEPQPPSRLRPELANWPGLDALVLRLLARDREQRPKDAAELPGLIDAIAYVPPRTSPANEPEPRQATARANSGPDERKTGKKPQRHAPVWVWPASAALLVCAAFAAWRIFAPQPSKPPVKPSEQTAPAVQTQPVEPKPVVSTSPQPSNPLPAAPQQPKPAANPAGVALTVTCDLACDWKLDGEAKGRIDASGTARVKVETGRHALVAVTQDGLDRTETSCSVSGDGKAVAHLRLQSVRDARLKAEQVASDKAAREAKDRAAKEQQEQAQKGREPANSATPALASQPTARITVTPTQISAGQQVVLSWRTTNASAVTISGIGDVPSSGALSRSPTVTTSYRLLARGKGAWAEDKAQVTVNAPAPALTWTDPATGLTWAKKDNGYDVAWQQAADYCRNLQLAGQSGWRLATRKELVEIYNPNANVDGWRVKGNLQLSGLEWSGSQERFLGLTKAWALDFRNFKGNLYLLGDRIPHRALCVRR